MSILNKIDRPENLRQLSPADLPELCADIRRFMIENLSHNPGHFGSSMGAVEIIVALHYVLNTPRDRVVWDVGHQAYAHKILTGRRDLFPNQRTQGGISGFPFPAESEYDTFVCGHAGNSISAALGMAIADLNSPGEEDRKTVAVIGDASISNGLAFEGLNNASINPNNLLIILNDNDMSIDDPVGAMHRYLLELTTSPSYNKMRFKLYNLFKKMGLINDKRKGLLLRFSNSLKALIAAHQNIFEGLNIRYFGPFDGNDINKVVKVLNEIKDMKGPRILHLRTVKGKGYKVAEKNPQAWHAPGNFDPETGEKIKSVSGNPLWQEVFGDTLVDIASKDDRVVGITAAMLSGTSMSKMMDKFPKRTFDVGISEGHAVTFAGGLAAAGKKPFVAIYSSFLQRGFDNIIHDVAIQGLPVVFCIDRAGLVGEDGVTHHGLFDMVYLRMIPNIIVSSPMDIASLKALMRIADKESGPMAIRYPRGSAEGDPDSPVMELTVGKGRQIHQSSNARVAILTIGRVGNDALQAARELAAEGIDIDVFDMIWVKPLDVEILKKVAGKYDAVLTVEDGARNGGFGSAVTEALTELDYHKDIVRLGVPDEWIYHAKVGQLRAASEIDARGIKKNVVDLLKKIAE
ncbi:MAG: 1-deoxy-D-xylulose-5-phosphate synthase [Muribaculaceae bacterium]|nr:1-deoxy-D-xylulose-5-phosphate synthase [Muribaculaceae bacterium]